MHRKFTAWLIIIVGSPLLLGVFVFLIVSHDYQPWAMNTVLGVKGDSLRTTLEPFIAPSNPCPGAARAWRQAVLDPERHSKTELASAARTQREAEAAYAAARCGPRPINDGELNQTRPGPGVVYNRR